MDLLDSIDSKRQHGQDYSRGLRTPESMETIRLVTARIYAEVQQAAHAFAHQLVLNGQIQTPNGSSPDEKDDITEEGDEEEVD